MNMGLFDRFKKKTSAPASAEKPAKVSKKSAKDIATEKGEPYVAVLSMDVDPDNLSAGSFELDWNDKFILQLQRFGYQGKSDADLVDQWFTSVCRNVVLETFEQEQADPENRNPNRFVQNTKMTDGKREYR
jgi:hypothetical protein